MKKNTKTQVPTIIIIVYIILSALYILYTGWQNFQTQYAQTAFDNGRRSAIEQILVESSTDDCKAFRVYNESAEAQLINVACLQTDSTASTEE